MNQFGARDERGWHIVVFSLSGFSPCSADGRCKGGRFGSGSGSRGRGYPVPLRPLRSWLLATRQPRPTRPTWMRTNPALPLPALPDGLYPQEQRDSPFGEEALDALLWISFLFLTITIGLLYLVSDTILLRLKTFLTIHCLFLLSVCMWVWYWCDAESGNLFERSL